MRRRLAIEAGAVAAAAAALWAVIYSPWMAEPCCAIVEEALLLMLLVAAMIGGALTGTLHNPGRYHALIGMIVEALVLWAIVRLALRVRKPRSGPSASGRDTD